MSAYKRASVSISAHKCPGLFPGGGIEHVLGEVPRVSRAVGCYLLVVLSVGGTFEADIPAEGAFLPENNTQELGVAGAETRRSEAIFRAGTSLPFAAERGVASEMCSDGSLPSTLRWIGPRLPRCN